MEKIYRILNSRWAIFLAFLPFVNFICIIFHFFTVKESIPSFLVKLLLGLPFVGLLFILPEQWHWVVAQLSASAVAAWMLVKARGHYRTGKSDRVPNSRKMIAVALITVLVAGFAISMISSDVNQQMNGAIDALVHRDQEKWQSYMHPSCKTTVFHLDLLIPNLARSGIRLSADYRISTEITVKPVKKYPEGSSYYEKEMWMGGKHYRFFFVYLENEKGSGFIDFGIFH